MRNLCLPLTVVFSLLLTFDAVNAEVPAADDLSSQPVNYHKAATNLATGGAPKQDELASLKAAGVEYYIDLRTEGEGIQITESLVRDSGLKYYSLPLGRGQPSEELLERFEEIMAHHANDDHYLFCASGNRAGTVWAQYLIRQGVDVEEAIQQGIDSGMAPSRVKWFRK